MKAKERFRITEYQNPSGRTVWRVQGHLPDATRVRKNFTDHADAVSQKAELEVRALNQPGFGFKRTRLTDEQLAQAESAFLKLGGRSLLAAVDCYLAQADHHLLVTRTVRRAYEEFIAMKETKKKLRPRTLDDYQSRLSSLNQIFDERPSHSITRADVEPLIFKPGQSPYTANDNRRVLYTFFEWCRKQKYAMTNPIDGIEPAGLDDAEPEILTLAEVKLLLCGAMAHKQGKMLPFVVFGLFMGMRPDEIARLRWDHVDLDQRLLRVQGDVAKLRKRRVIAMPENVAEWLRVCFGKPIVPTNERRDLDVVRRLAGYKGSSTSLLRTNERNSDIQRRGRAAHPR